MPNCKVCGLLCSTEISIVQHVETNVQGFDEAFIDAIFFCSDLCKYRCEICFHTQFYGTLKQVINHLIAAHGCDVPLLEKALNWYLKAEGYPENHCIVL